jgi:hypothetical protein
MVHAGVPLDVERLHRITENWTGLKLALIAELDKDFGVFDGVTLKQAKFKECMARRGIPWPTTPTGRPRRDKETFKTMVGVYPELEPLYTLTQRLAPVDLRKLEVGVDGRNRSALYPFGSRPGRNTPSQNKFLMGLPGWTRNLCKPDPDMALAWLDYKSQEPREAGWFARDQHLLGVLSADDPYIAVGKLIGYITDPDATKATAPRQREVAKVLTLGTFYGMGPQLFAAKTGLTVAEAAHLHRRLRTAFSRYFEWSDKVLSIARQYGYLQTEFGWRRQMIDASARSARNFPMQANGAEMLRLAVCRLTESRDFAACGGRVLAPIHDALVIEAPTAQLEEAVKIAEREMGEASRQVLRGYTVGVEVETVCYPDHYKSNKHPEMWETVLRHIGEED